MSWKEYKTKRGNDNTNSFSSWEEYKRKREEEKNKTLLPTYEEQKSESSNELLLPILNKNKNINITPQVDTENMINRSQLISENAIKKTNNNDKQANTFRQQQLQNKLEQQAANDANNINKDMSNGNYMSAIGHILKGVPQKALDATTTTFASANSIIAPKTYRNEINENELLKTNKKLSKQYEQVTGQINNEAVQTASGVSGTIGQMVPSIILNTALPGIGTVVQGVNVGAEAYQDTLNEEATNKGQATATGVLKGVASALIEKISGGNLVGKGSLDDAAAKLISNKFKGKVGQKLASKAYEMIGEIGEENLENQVDHIIDKLMNNDDNVKDFNGWWNEAKETTKSTFLTTLVLNLLGMGGSTYNDVQDIKTQKFVDEAKKIIQTDINKNTNLNVDEKINKLNEVYRIQDINDYNNYTANEQRRNLVKQINQDTNLDVDTKVELLNNLNKIETSDQFSEFLKKNNDSLKKISSNKEIEQVNLPTQQSISQNNKMPQNQTSEQINELMNNKAAPLQNYQYIKSDNAKIDALRQDANKFFVNNEKAKNYVNMLEKIITDKDVTIRLDPNLKDSNGKIANGSYSNGVITINPNSTRAGEFIAIHELTHAIGTNEMLNIVNTYRESNPKFDAEVKKLLQNYNGEEISEEALSDVAGQLFGNQEFINNLAQNNPNMFRRIYNEIKYLWHQFTGYKNKNQFIEDLKFKWEQAYKEYEGYNDTTKYSIAGIEAKNNAIKNDKHFKFIEDAYNEAVRMENEGKTNREILQNTNWYKDSNGDWKFEFSDSDMELKKTNFVSNKIYKLKDVLDHDILYLYYPELKEYNVVFKNKRTGGSYNENEKLIAIGNNKINNPAEIKGTLIHEIQHAIQNIEGYSTGTTSKKGWFRYLNTLGEIEAADTKDRFINGYKGMPETAKDNPVHPIIKNSNNIVEKIGNSLYNYFNGGLNYGKENKSNDEENTSRNKNVVELGERSINETENSNKSSFSMQKIQGLENYNIQELKSSFKSDIKNILEDNDIYDVDIVDIDLHGSRLRGTAKNNSDLDVVVQYDGDIREDTLFDILNENPIEIDGIKVDINPIKENIKDYMNRSKEYDQEILSKNKSSKDNQGRILTKEQQDFFKDSKVRDENGNLITVYHGTPTGGFTIYDTSRLGKTTKAKDAPIGIHFTDNLDMANQFKDFVSDEIKIKAKEEIDKKYDLKYGIAPFDMIAKLNQETKELAEQRVKENGEVKEQYLNIKKPMSIFADYGISEQQLADDLVYIATGEKNIANVSDYFEDNLDMLSAVQQNLNNELAELKDELAKPDAIKRFKELGYDGLILPIQTTDKLGLAELNLNTKGNEYIVFNSNQAKNVDNMKPTSNDDIRYSKSNEEWTNYLNNNFKNIDNKGRKLSKEQQEYFKDTKILDRNGLLLTLYHGTNNDFNVFDKNYVSKNTKNAGFYGDGFYFTPDKESAKQYGKNSKEVYLDIKNPFAFSELSKVNGEDYYSDYIQIMNLVDLNPEWGNIPVKFADKNTWKDINNDVKKMLSEDKSDEEIDNYMYEKYGEIQEKINDRLYNYSKKYNYKTLSDVLQEKGYDGIINRETPENSSEIVAFNSNQIKNVDNTNPTSNSDIRYSKENQTWQQYLEKNFKANGTRTNLKEINLPTAADIERLEKNNKLSNKEPELPKTKQDLLDNNSKAINKYIQEKNNSIRNISAQIEEYNNRLKAIQDKNSVEANKIKSKIIELTNKSNDIETLYNNKIDKAIAKGQKLLKTPDMTGRKAVIQKNRELARERIENIADWKDKSNGFKYQRETMERNMFDIIPDRQEAQKMIDTYFEPVHESEANKQRFINKYNDKIKELNLNKYESEAVQLLGEEKYNPDFNKDSVADVLDRVTKNINDGKVDKSKVDKAIETFRSIYDELFDLENQALKENGYPEKPYRKGYFPHFVDAEPVSNIEKFLDKFGFKVDRRPLPTDIAGITEQFVPGKTWNRSALHRKTDTTTYNALKGFDTYISQAADNIFHTENIQKLRALENEIRYQYSEEGIQTRIDEIYNNDALTQDEQQAAIERIFEQVDNPMPNLVTELRRYTNALANKKSEADRSAEQKYGRQIYSTVNAIENRFGANAVGLNIGSAITNFIPITQAYSQVSTKNMGRAFMDTIKSYVNDDGFTNNSTFLTNRLNQSEKLYKTSLEKISDKTSFLFNAIDNVASNIVVRGKYLQNLDEGMNVQEAMKNADRFGANLMADRSKGSMPTLFNEKSPITKAFSQFQLEVNNQYSYMFKDLPRDMKDKGIANLALAFFKMFVAAFLYNKASEEIVGRKPAFSPIDIALDSYNTLSDENTSTADKVINVGKDVAEELPFVGGFLGGGRIPVSGALPDVENTFKAATGLATGEMDSKKATNTLQKELTKPLYYLLPPFGGGQLKKTVEGVSTVANGGSYGVDSKGNDTLQFPVENPNVGDYLKAGLFGKYALEHAKEYSNRGYKSLNAKQTQIYKEAQIPYKELLDYIDKDLKKNEDKISYIESQNLNDNQKWGIYKYDILSNTERKDGGSQLSDAEYMIKNGMTKGQYIDMYNKAQKNNLDIPTEKEYKKLTKNGIKINDYMDFKVKEKQETQKKKKNGELKESQSLKDKDRIQILLDSKYSDKETKAIYETQIKNAKDVTYDILDKSGIDIKEYLKYKQQEFESDKKDDGTTTGKAVSGSKKTKVYSYVNNMNISYNQKLLLLSLQYNLTSVEKTKLANYVNNMDLSKQDKLDIYEKLSGFTVYKDGRVTW